MAILTLGDKKIAIGVEWSLQESKSALRKACAEKKKALRLVISHDDGFVLGLCEDARSNDLYAGAGIIAHVYRNAVLCEKIEGLDAQSECFWICAVSDGVPLCKILVPSLLRIIWNLPP